MHQHLKEDPIKFMGFLVMGLYLVMVGLTRLNNEHSIFDGSSSCTVPAFLMGAILVAAALYLIYRSDVITGMVFLLTGFAAVCLGMTNISGYNDSFRVVIVIGSLILMYMSIRIKDLDMVVLNALNAIVYLIAMNTLSNVIPSDLIAVLLIIIGAYAIYMALKFWDFVQQDS